MKTKTDQAWDDLCAAAERPAPAAPVLPRVHPFDATMGEGPYYFVSLVEEQSRCSHCSRPIKNVYRVRNGAGEIFPVGSECILSLGNGFSAHLVGEVKVAKRRYEKQQKAAREKKRAIAIGEESKKIHPAEVAFLESYSGNFDFYLSLRSQFQRNGDLSERQWESLTRAVAKAAAPKPPRTFTLMVGETLILNKFFAHIIGRDTGLNKPHFAIEVLEVQAESEKAWKIKGRLSAQRTSYCCVCGLRLTNAVSVLAGIGPICADRYEVSSTEELHAKLQTQYKATVEIWIPKSQVKERKAANG